MPSNSWSVIEGVISVDADAGLLVAVRTQPSGQGLRSQNAGPVPRMRSEGASCRVGHVGAPERLKPGCPLRTRQDRLDARRWCDSAPGGSGELPQHSRGQQAHSPPGHCPQSEQQEQHGCHRHSIRPMIGGTFLDRLQFLRDPVRVCLLRALLHGSGPSCTDWSLAARSGRYRRAAPFLTSDSHRAIQSEPRSPSSHPEAATQSDELGRL